MGRDGDGRNYRGALAMDYYGRIVPRHAHGTGRIDHYTNSAQTLRDARRQNRETGQRERERLEEQSRQEDQSLTAAQPALAELLTRQLLREEGDGT